MAKILKHFGIGNKKSGSSPAHKCKIDATDSPQLGRSSKDQLLQNSKSGGTSTANSPTTPSKSPFDYPPRSFSLTSGDIQDDQGTSVAMNLGRPPASPPDSRDSGQPVYSAVIKERITPDSILNEIASKLSVSEEKSGEQLSTFGKNSSSKSSECGAEAKKMAAEKLPDVIKADSSLDIKVLDYDDPYEEGPIKVLQQIDSGVSSLKSSSTTLNQVQVRGSTTMDDTLEKKKQTTCVGETQVGFETLKSWNMDKSASSSSGRCLVSTTTSEADEDSDNTLEGKDINPPPIPAKTYNLANELPPPPPNLLLDGEQEPVTQQLPPPRAPPRPIPQGRANPPVPDDQPWDLSAKMPPTNKSDTWSNGRRYDDEMIPMPSGPAPEPPLRDNWRGDGPRAAPGDVRSRHESLMMRSAYGLEACNYPPGQYYYPQQQPAGPPPPSSQQLRHHYRSGSVKSMDYRPGIEYDEPWDQQHPFFCQTGSMPPDSMRSYQMMPRQYSSSRASSSSWIHNSMPEKIDPRIPLEEQFWFHGTIGRVEAENILRMHREGSFLIRMSESNRFDFSLSLKSARGFMHMKIVTNPDGRYILGQFSQPFTSIPLMIHHYTLHKLPIKGAEHMSLVYPVGMELL